VSQSNTVGDNGTVNTGGGGGAGSGYYLPAGSGGSGIVILRFPTTAGMPTVGAGLTYTDTTSGSDTVITFTAGSDTIAWS
jgi:hypothetical protein